MTPVLLSLIGLALQLPAIALCIKGTHSQCKQRVVQRTRIDAIGSLRHQYKLEKYVGPVPTYYAGVRLEMRNSNPNSTTF